MKRRSPVFLLIGGLFFLILAFLEYESSDQDFENSRQIIVMRQIAHRILLHAGDSSSRVLPIELISTTEFRINFETDFSFQPDTLVKIISQVILENGISSDYIVNVLENSSGKVVFGYAMLGTEKNSIIPCLGRDQPVKRYRINIKFHESLLTRFHIFLYVGLLAMLISIGGWFYQLKSNRSNSPAASISEVSKPYDQVQLVGNFQFYIDQQVLLLGEERIELTSKEAQLLQILTANINQVVDRKKLQKEVWEDEGVIVKRSLDMFISKLRKKLSGDPHVKLANIHGKGYKLELERMDP